jgi:deoxyadenosine/deoxycytidine kinase
MSEPAFKQPRYIVVEGPIRVGKSTLARALSERLHANRVFDCDDNPFLAGFYDEKPGAALAAQMHFLYERHRRLIEAEIDDNAAPTVGDFLFEKDKIFAYINLNNDMLAPSVPSPDLVIYLQATPEVLKKRVSKKGHPAEAEIAQEYIETVANAYEHFFFRYSGSNLLVVDTSDIDFVERNGDLQELLRRLRQPVKGTQYFLPLGQS